MLSLNNLFRDLVPLLVKRHRKDGLGPFAKGSFSGPGEERETRVREISVRELARLKEFPVIVDVREEEEFSTGHIEGARNVSRAELELIASTIIPDLASPIVVYCARGSRGALAADSLQKLGYRNVFSLKGGLSGWLEAGGLVETRRH